MLILPCFYRLGSFYLQTGLFAAITRKTGNNFLGRPIEPEKKVILVFSPMLTKREWGWSPKANQPRPTQQIYL